MAHVDTADDVPGNGVKPPRVIASYEGKDIPLNEEHTLKVEDNPELLRYKGETVIVTDGNTLLGSDDKAGVAEIMSAAEYLLSHPEIKHGWWSSSSPAMRKPALAWIRSRTIRSAVTTAIPSMVVSVMRSKVNVSMLQRYEFTSAGG